MGFVSRFARAASAAAVRVVLDEERDGVVGDDVGDESCARDGRAGACRAHAAICGAAPGDGVDGLRGTFDAGSAASAGPELA